MVCTLLNGLIDETPVILGSRSPRRARILEGLDVEFTIDRPSVEELAVEGETPEDHVARLSREKALDVSGRHERGTLIAADTIVLLDGRVLGKPADPGDAIRMLTALRGRWHEVLTGVTVVRCSDGGNATGVERTRVLFRRLTDAEIVGYVGCGEPLDKAGAYAIQDCGAAVVERVEGCFYNVVGLPVARLCRALEELRAGHAGGSPERTDPGGRTR